MQNMQTYAPCPKCSAVGAERMSFTWWGGLIGPKILTHVKCPQCSYAYNGKNGTDNTTRIVIYSVVVFGIVFAILLVAFIALGILISMTK